MSGTQNAPPPVVRRQVALDVFVAEFARPHLLEALGLSRTVHRGHDLLSADPRNDAAEWRRRRQTPRGRARRAKPPVSPAGTKPAASNTRCEAALSGCTCASSRTTCRSPTSSAHSAATSARRSPDRGARARRRPRRRPLRCARRCEPHRSSDAVDFADPDPRRGILQARGEPRLVLGPGDRATGDAVANSRRIVLPSHDLARVGHERRTDPHATRLGNYPAADRGEDLRPARSSTSPTAIDRRAHPLQVVGGVDRPAFVAESQPAAHVREREPFRPAIQERRDVLTLAAIGRLFAGGAQRVGVHHLHVEALRVGARQHVARVRPRRDRDGAPPPIRRCAGR